MVYVIKCSPSSSIYISMNEFQSWVTNLLHNTHTVCIIIVFFVNHSIIKLISKYSIIFGLPMVSTFFHYSVKNQYYITSLSRAIIELTKFFFLKKRHQFITSVTSIISNERNNCSPISFWIEQNGSNTATEFM